jgi:hypothetical protein
MHHKHLIDAVVRDTVLLDHVAQRENVGNGFFIILYVRMISQHDCLFFRFHGYAIAF